MPLSGIEFDQKLYIINIALYIILSTLRFYEKKRMENAMLLRKAQDRTNAIVKLPLF